MTEALQRRARRGAEANSRVSHFPDTRDLTFLGHFLIKKGEPVLGGGGALKGLSLGCEVLLPTPYKSCSSRRQHCPSRDTCRKEAMGQLQTHLVRVLQ